MGLLMHPSIRILCAAMLAALVTTGCRSGISIESPLFAGAGDWPQLGGNAARSGIADGALATPLREAWRESTAGGQAGAAPLAVGGKILVTSVTGGIDIFDPANGESNGYITVRPVIAGTALVAGGTLLLPFSQ